MFDDNLGLTDSEELFSCNGFIAVKGCVEVSQGQKFRKVSFVWSHTWCDPATM